MSYHVLTYRPPKAYRRARKPQEMDPLPHSADSSGPPDAAAQMALGYAIATTLSNLPPAPAPSPSDSYSSGGSGDSPSGSSSGSGSSSSD
jgi:hypothetical protein